MVLTNTHVNKVTSYFLLALVATQVLYTLLYMAQVGASRQILWGLEACIFTILIAFSGAAMVQAKEHHLGWSAIVFSAVLNIIQVSIGLTMFVPFREVSAQLNTLSPLAGAVIAFSFMVYYAAKLLLGFAALIFGFAVLKMGAKALGGMTIIVGIVAMLANSILIIFGRDALLPSAAAGGTGVIATLLVALCLLYIANQKSAA